MLSCAVSCFLVILQTWIYIEEVTYSSYIFQQFYTPSHALRLKVVYFSSKYIKTCNVFSRIIFFCFFQLTALFVGLTMMDDRDNETLSIFWSTCSVHSIICHRKSSRCFTGTCSVKCIIIWNARSGQFEARPRTGHSSNISLAGKLQIFKFTFQLPKNVIKCNVDE